MTEQQTQAASFDDEREHIAWLKQYVLGMNENNWCDMRLRAIRQFEKLDAALQSSPQETR
jgi:hypothetical protein